MLKELIEEKLKCLIGKPLIDAGRASNLVWFSFGQARLIPTRTGKFKIVGDFSLNVQCSWRVSYQERLVVASKDIYRPKRSWQGDVDNFFWDIPGMSRCDDKLESFIKESKSKLSVSFIEADDLGGIKIILLNNTILELFPDESEDSEHWRFFTPGSEESHFIVTPDGIDG